MQFLSVVEHRKTPINADWFDPTSLPSYSKDYFNIFLDPSLFKPVIETGSYTGIIPFDQEYGLKILPKSGLSNLTYMLYRSGLLNKSLETPFEQTVPYQIPEDDIESFFEGLVNSFLQCLDEIKSFGLIRNTELEDRTSNNIKGKINNREWIKRFPINWGIPIPQKVFVPDINNLANRTLRWCLEYLAYSPMKYVFLEEIYSRIDYFGNIPITPITQEEQTILSYEIGMGNFPSSRYYYLPALNLALLILRGAGLSIGDNEDVFFKPIVINTYDMFERYIRNLCQDTSTKFLARAENGKLIPMNFYTKPTTSVQVKPDIVIKYGGSSILVADVKYKTEPTEQDHYQLWAYMQTYQVQYGGFISIVDPSSNKESRTNWFERENATIFNFSFDCRQIKMSEKKLDELMSKLITQSVH